MNVIVGGMYRIEMRSPENNAWIVFGEFKEIKTNKKLVFTWNTEEVIETTVTIEFKEMGNKTEVNLLHDLLPDQEQVDEHSYGWTGCMDNLSSKVLI